MLRICAVIYRQPAPVCADRRCAGAYAGAVPHPRPAFQQALVISPLPAIGRFRQPDKITADLLAAGPVQAIKLAVYSFFEQRTVLVMRRKDHTAIFKML